MTDEQAERLIAVQTAQLAMLHGIFNNAMVVAKDSGQPQMYNWNEVKKLLDNAVAIRKS